MEWYEHERRALVATLRKAGPDAPTLCEGWRTRHLAAHLYLRLHQPGRIAAAMLPGTPDADTLTARWGDDHGDASGYERLLQDFAAEPARHNPMRLTGNRVHLLEYVVHHEDVRRGSGAVPARDLPAPMRAALWQQVRATGRLTQRRMNGGVVLVVPDGPRAVVRRGPHALALIGHEAELALYLTGRREHAQVELVRSALQRRAPAHRA